MTQNLADVSARVPKGQGGGELLQLALFIPRRRQKGWKHSKSRGWEALMPLISGKYGSRLDTEEKE